MKQVIAIIRAEKWSATRAVIDELGIEAVTHHRVLGRGRQRGLRYLRRATESGEGDMPYLPKRMLVCLVPDQTVTELISAIIKLNQTGNVGDGKIFVCPLEQVEGADDRAAEPVAATT